MNLRQKQALIEEEEEKFAGILALRVIERPTLNIWMILIPIIFVHYFYRFQKFAGGRKEFVRNYMISRKRALCEAFRALETGSATDLSPLIRQAKLPAEVLSEYGDLLSVLIDHYTKLLRAKGDHWDVLVRQAYATRGNYLLFLNRLNASERKLDAALRPFMAGATEGFDEIVTSIEDHSERLRRERAERIFP